MSEMDVEMTIDPPIVAESIVAPPAPASSRADKGKAKEPEKATLALDALPWVEKFRPVTLGERSISLPLSLYNKKTRIY